ncbi:MAG TPA: tetratricopeptide repeat protein, partial [Balneolaceae bacterium]|nr:tetratricopeptide repeat protein [Balneolaceae bacterium]
AYMAEAFVWHQKALKGEVPFDASLEQQVPLFEKALKLEEDLSVRARINRRYRNRSLDYGYVAKAVEIGERYVEDAPTISTYLRDRKDEAMAFVKSIYSKLGYAGEAIPFFENLVQQKPQHFGFRLMYADVLLQAGKPNEAMNILKEGHKILSAANDERPAYLLRIAKVYLKKDDAEAAKKWLNEVDAEQLSFQQKLMLAELYLTMSETEKAVAALPEPSDAEVPNEKAALSYVKAMVQEAKGNLDKAVKEYDSTLALNPYHLKARARLAELLQKLGESDEAQQVRQQGESLAIPPGPDLG